MKLRSLFTYALLSISFCAAVNAAQNQYVIRPYNNTTDRIAVENIFSQQQNINSLFAYSMICRGTNILFDSEHHSDSFNLFFNHKSSKGFSKSFRESAYQQLMHNPDKEIAKAGYDLINLIDKNVTFQMHADVACLNNKPVSNVFSIEFTFNFSKKDIELLKRIADLVKAKNNSPYNLDLNFDLIEKANNALIVFNPLIDATHDKYAIAKSFIAHFMDKSYNNVVMILPETIMLKIAQSLPYNLTVNKNQNDMTVYEYHSGSHDLVICCLPGM